MISLGIDLAGKEDNPTGFAILEDNKKVDTEVLYSSEEILNKCKSVQPDVVSIDSPLCFPEDGDFRKADSELINRGYQVFSPVMGGMKSLTERGIELCEKLEEDELEVIETHPLTSGKIIFDSSSRDLWVSKLTDKGLEMNSQLTDDEIDSVLSALTGVFYLKERFDKVGEDGEEIVIPRKDAKVL